MLPGMKMSQLAHELGHAIVAVVAGYEVMGIVLDPAGSAATYTSFDPLNVHGQRDQFVGTLILSAGTMGAAVFAAGMLVAVSKMRTGRLVIVSVATALTVVAFLCVPDDAELPMDGTGSPDVGGYTSTYSMVAAAVLLIAALPGGTVTRATTYALAAMASAGLAADVRELWLPSQHPTDAGMAASLTAVPVGVWRGAWTVAATLVVAGGLVQLVQSPNGWPLRRFIYRDHDSVSAVAGGAGTSISVTTGARGRSTQKVVP
jgi:hypothetical protein